MSEAQNKAKKQTREARLVIVAELYKKGYSMGAIAKEVISRMDVKTCSKATIHSDIKILLKEWRNARFEDMDDALLLELARIDHAVQELWEAWEKSKIDRTAVQKKVKGNTKPTIEEIEHSIDKATVNAASLEKTEKYEVHYGDPRYLSEIRMQLSERRKLLGLYAPDKKLIKVNSDDFEGFDAFMAGCRKVSPEDNDQTNEQTDGQAA